MKAIEILEVVTMFEENNGAGLYRHTPVEGIETEDERLRMFFGMVQYTGVFRIGATYFYTYSESIADKLNQMQVFDCEVIDDFDQQIWCYRIED